MRKVDLTGKVFHEWTVASEAEQAGKHTRWNCVCSCGKSRVVYGTHLTTGRSKSCSAGGNHGASKKTPGYSSWLAMRSRCTNTKHHAYHLYGGRGIRICPEWANDFLAFHRDMGERPKGMTLERIDTNGNYTPENCVWASVKEQANNRRDNRYVAHEGERFTISQLADKLGINYETLYSRIRKREARGETVRL